MPRGLRRKTPVISRKVYKDEFRKASIAWEAEREQPDGADLPAGSLACRSFLTIEQPSRTTQTIKDQFEVKLAEANRLHLETETGVLAGQSDLG